MRHIANLLALRDWEIVIDWAPSAEDTCAEIQPLFGQKRAVMSFGPNFLALSSGEQRQTVAHELIHCHLFATTEHGRISVAELTDASAARALHATLEHHVEIATDALADAFGPLLPLPPWRS